MRTVGELKNILGITLTKEKTYVDNPSAAPEGADVKQGPKGGYYYESVDDKPSSLEDDIEKYKNMFKDMDTDQLKKYGKSLEIAPPIKDEFIEWYGGYAMTDLDNVVTKTFGISEETSRTNSDTNLKVYESTGRPDYNVDADKKDALIKLYSVNQELLNRMHPSGVVTLYRGVDGKTKEKFKGMNVGDKVSMDCYNVSSWSDDGSVADNFARQRIQGGVAIKIEVPIKRILQYHEVSEIAIQMEGEYILMGSKVEGSIEGIFQNKMTGE